MVRTAAVLHHPCSPAPCKFSPTIPFVFHYKNLRFFPKSLSSSSLSLCPSPSSPTPRVSTAPVEYAPAPDSDFQKEIQRLQNLRSRLSNSPNLESKLRVLDSDSRVSEFFSSFGIGLPRVLSPLGLGLSELFLLKCLVAAGQEHVIKSESLESAFGGFYADEFVTELRKLIRTLGEIEEFYDCIGGIIG